AQAMPADRLGEGRRSLVRCLRLGLGIGRDGSQETGLPQPFFDRYSLLRRRSGRGVGQLAHVLDKYQVGPSQVDLVPGRQLPLRIKSFPVEARAVEAIEIAQTPAAFAVVDLRVLPAAQV